MTANRKECIDLTEGRSKRKTYSSSTDISKYPLILKAQSEFFKDTEKLIGPNIIKSCCTPLPPDYSQTVESLNILEKVFTQARKNDLRGACQKQNLQTASRILFKRVKAEHEVILWARYKASLDCYKGHP